MTRPGIVHPGPPHRARLVVLRGRAETARWVLRRGDVLLDALAAPMEASGAGAAVVLLGGVSVAGGDYVMPARAADGAHAAWYSAARPIGPALITAATAMVGRRNGRWFVHCHALWPGAAGPLMGHLLNETVRIGADAEVQGWLFHGGGFVARQDTETNFALFAAEGEGGPGQAALLTVRPHEDLRLALAATAAETGLRNAAVFGLGSLIGARFADAPAMVDPISEMLVLPGAEAGHALPVAAVDLGGAVHRGELLAGPICVTGEFLLVGGQDQTRAQNSG